MNPLDRMRMSDGYFAMVRAHWEGKPQPHPNACSCPECIDEWFQLIVAQSYADEWDDEAGQ